MITIHAARCLHRSRQMEPDNSREYYDWRMAERRALRLNAPRKGPKGLAKLVAIMQGVEVHPLTCKCAECIPPEVEAWMRAHPQTFPQYSSAAVKSPELPVVGEHFQGNRGFKPPAQKWDKRCSTCEGRGEIRDIHGTLIPCPRCADE